MRAFRVFAVITAVLCVCGVVSGQQYQYRGPGLATLEVIAGQHMNAGMVNIWNTGMPLDRYGTDAGNKLLVEIILTDEWAVTAAQLYAGKDEVPTKKGSPVPGQFPFKYEFAEPKLAHDRATFWFVLDLRDDVGFQWGTKHGAERIINVALHLDLVRLDADGNVMDEQEGAWAGVDGDGFSIPFEGPRWGWWLKYQLAHPIKAQFIDAKVHGVEFATQTHWGVTGKYGGFAYFPGETADFTELMPFHPDGPVTFGRRGVAIAEVEGSFRRPGPATVWLSMRVPLVDGEPVTGTQIACVLGDFVNGMLTWRKYSDPVPPTISDFFNRPFCVLFADRFADSVKEAIQDPALRQLESDIGAVDQFADCTDLTENIELVRRLAVLYRRPGQ